MAIERLDGAFCRVEVIAQLFGVSVRRVQQITQEGIIETVQTSEGRRYELVPTVQKYVEHLSKKAKGRSTSEQIDALKKQKLRAEVALKESQGEMHRLKTDIASGKYIDIEQVKIDYGKFFIVFKNFAMGLPARVAGRISAYCDPVETRAIESDLSEEINRMLSGFVVAGCTEEEIKKKREKPKKV